MTKVTSRMSGNTLATNRISGSQWLAIGAAVLALAAIFVWIYARFAGTLYFAMDDYIESEAALAKPLGAVVGDFFAGRISWSGYRPVAYSVRAAMVHLFGTQEVTGYYLVSLGLHFANTLLTFHLVWRVARWVIPAFVAALFFLLLPSHNEAVLYMSASANLMALFLALLALEAGLTLPLAERAGNAPGRAATWLLIGVAALAYWLAILTYEVTLPLIGLILLADWALASDASKQGWRDFLRRRAPLYFALGAAAALALGMRLWMGGGAMAPERTDYGVSFAPDHLLRGYSLLLSQIALLYNSPWMHLPDYVYTREWMALTNPRALASIMLTVVAVCGVFWLAFRNDVAQVRARSALLWIGWGLLWALLVALPFAALAGRNPENRYTYIPSFGVAVAVATLIAWLMSVVARQSWRRAGTIGITLLFAAWMGTYAWITTSDVAEFGRAGTHARTFLAAVSTTNLADSTTIVTVGIPGDVGSAYVFTTREALQAALRLNGAPPAANLISGDLELNRYILKEPREDMIVLGYDRANQVAQPIGWGLLCVNAADPATCMHVRFPAVDTAAPWLYLQIYDERRPQPGGIAMLIDASDTPALRSCWQFVDTSQVQVDPANFNKAAADAACADTFATLLPRIKFAIEGFNVAPAGTP